MNPQMLQTHVELALRKQRLQLRAAEQRAAAVAQLERIEGLLGVVDRARGVAHGLRDEAPLLAMGALVLLIARPRLALRLARRVWFGWVVYRRAGRALDSLTTLLRRFSGAAAPR